MDTITPTSTTHKLDARPGDTLVVTCQQQLTVRQREIAHLFFSDHFPDNKVVVLDSCAQLSVMGSEDRLGRIETKLDALLEALADDEPEQEPAIDLDGNAAGGERDTMQTL